MESLKIGIMAGCFPALLFIQIHSGRIVDAIERGNELAAITISAAGCTNKTPEKKKGDE